MTKPMVIYTEIPEEFMQSWGAPYMVVKSSAPGWSKGDDFDTDDMERSPEVEFVLDTE